MSLASCVPWMACPVPPPPPPLFPAKMKLLAVNWEALVTPHSVAVWPSRLRINPLSPTVAPAVASASVVIPSAETSSLSSVRLKSRLS